jgi:hypothetical protein
MFRFTIRDVLWLTLVVAVLVTAWINYRARLSVEAQNDQLRARTIELAEHNARQKAILDSRPVTGSNWEQAGPVNLRAERPGTDNP